ncbi:hypothetical protein GJ496_006538 [Pomphorhynchus laevis]|nr:hypothetical protein GJ496_006600 [Pomphorhynchus laevis]KAI0986011.1 hypothetical protein GJ496_006538 [Pomphorhynchus laevis]
MINKSFDLLSVGRLGDSMDCLTSTLLASCQERNIGKQFKHYKQRQEWLRSMQHSLTRFNKILRFNLDVCEEYSCLRKQYCRLNASWRKARILRKEQKIILQA